MAWWKNWRSSAAVLLAAASTAGPLSAGPDGSTPLLIAVHEGRTADALRLLKDGADATQANRYGVTPLSLACNNGDADLVKALLAGGADANTERGGGETVLMTAAKTGVPKCVSALIAAGARVDATSDRAETAIMWAATEGHGEVVKLLLDEGADWQRRLGSGYNAWFLAARDGRGAVIDALLEQGAEVNAPMQTKNTNWGRSPTAGTTALILAVENGHFEMATKLLAAGADANDMRSGFAPLHVLTWVRKPRKGDGIDGAPPPYGSGDMTSLEFVGALVKHGADTNARLKRGGSSGKILGRPGSTPFLLASQTADLPLMKLLVKQGADFRMPNGQGRTPLMAAAGIGIGPEGDEASTEDEALLAVEYLLELGAELDVVDKEGDTIMHAAAYKQAPKMVRLLAEGGADIAVWNRKNKRGWTPLLIAQGFRYGNFKPSEATIAALSEAMLAKGVKRKRLSAPS